MLQFPAIARHNEFLPQTFIPLRFMKDAEVLRWMLVKSRCPGLRPASNPSCWLSVATSFS